MLCDSAMLIKHLSSDDDVSYVADCMSTCKLKIGEHQVKTFGSTKPVDVVGDICNFPFENIEESIYNPNSNYNHSKIFDDNNSNYKLDETKWVNKHQCTHTLRNPYSLQVDTTSKTNDQG